MGNVSTKTIKTLMLTSKSNREFKLGEPID